MIRGIRSPTLTVVIALLLAACSGGSPGTVRESPTGDPELWRTDPDEPYPFTTPVPPRAPTPVDGTYIRTYEEGTKPIPCRRCAPYRLDRGVADLELRAGRYRLVHEANAFTASGHFVIQGDRFELFNDPTCPETRGVYRWRVDGGTLTLQAIQDHCAFDLLRARYLSAAPWELRPG
jgi:hypothetical protein